MKSVHQSPGFFSLALSNLPTFKKIVYNHRTLSFIIFLSSYSLAVFLLIFVILARQQIERRISIPVKASQNLPLGTAYGSQRHVFVGADGRAIAIYLNQQNQVVAAVSDDGGVNWQERSQPLVEEAVEDVSGALDETGNLHLAYERTGQISYQKVTTLNDPWSISEPVNLDTSRLAHRPSLILDQDSQLPMVAWSSEFRVTPLRGVRILFMAAKADPTKLANWCNGHKDRCGISAFYFLPGTADVLGSRASHSIYHSVIAQLPDSGDLYLWWTNRYPNNRSDLNLVVGKKEGSGWRWAEEVLQEDQVSTYGSQNLTLSAASDSIAKQIVVAYIDKGGKAKTVAYSTAGKKDLGSPEEIGDQYSLTVGEGEYDLFYRNPDGRVGIRKFTGSASSPQWSGEIWQSSEVGGYPSALTVATGGKLNFIYITPENKVKIKTYQLNPPTSTPTPSFSPTPEPLPTASATPTATILPTATLTPTPALEATPTATP